MHAPRVPAPLKYIHRPQSHDPFKARVHTIDPHGLLGIVAVIVGGIQERSLKRSCSETPVGALGSRRHKNRHHDLFYFARAPTTPMWALL